MGLDAGCIQHQLEQWSAETQLDQGFIWKEGTTMQTNISELKVVDLCTTDLCTLLAADLRVEGGVHARAQTFRVSTLGIIWHPVFVIWAEWSTLASSTPK